MEEFERGQKLLGGRSLPKSSARNLALSGNLLSCSCSAAITGEEKYRKYCKDCKKKFNAEKYTECPSCKRAVLGEPNRYCYYRCTKRKNAPCDAPAITEEELNHQIELQLADLYLPQEFTDWALNQLRKAYEQEAKCEKAIDNTL